MPRNIVQFKACDVVFYLADGVDDLLRSEQRPADQGGAGGPGHEGQAIVRRLPTPSGVHYCTPNNYQDIHDGKDDTVWFLLLKIRKEKNNKNSVPARVILFSGHWSGSSRNRLLFDGDMTLFFLRLL